MPSDSPIRFAAFELQLETGELRKHGRKIKLPPKSFRLLALLAGRPGQLVTRDAIQRELWGADTFVDFEHGLNFCIRQIRSALGENAKKPRFIETLPRRGYRFIPEVSNHGDRQQINNTPTVIAEVESKTESTSVPAVALLEFENLSGDRSIDWLAVGIAETLATDLGRLQSVRVVTSDRVRAVRQQSSGPQSSNVDYGALGRLMDANWLVAGSYQRDGNRLRVIFRLYEVGTNQMVRATKVDGTWHGIFRLQDRMVRELIGVLGLTVDVSEKHRVTIWQTDQLEAYEQYSRGRSKLYVMGKGALDEALIHFERALALDPSYAMAHSGLGATHAMRFVHRCDMNDLLQAKSHLEQASQLDRELAEPYPWLCYVYMREGKLPEAMTAGHRAIELLPDFVQAHYFLALVYFLSCESDPGNYQSAANHLLQASRVKPNWLPTWFVLSLLALLNGNYQRAEEFAMHLMELTKKGPGEPGFIGAETLLGMVSLRRGNFGGACRWFTQSLETLASSDHMYREGLMAVSNCGLGDTYLREGKSEMALAAYRQAWQIVQEYPTMVAQDRHSVRALAGLAAAYAAQGDRVHSKKLLSQALEKLVQARRPQSGAAGANLADLYYAISVAHVRAENTVEALDALEKAVRAGWLDEDWTERDSELRPLLGVARFSELLQRIREFPKADWPQSAFVA